MCFLVSFVFWGEGKSPHIFLLLFHLHLAPKNIALRMLLVCHVKSVLFGFLLEKIHIQPIFSWLECPKVVCKF